MAERGGLLHPEIEDYDSKQTQQEVASGALLIDVREPHEWNAGHLPAATHIPMAQIPTRVRDLPRDRKLIFTCRTGNRSGTIKDYMIEEHGYTDVHNHLGGIVAWQLDGLPVEK